MDLAQLRPAITETILGFASTIIVAMVAVEGVRNVRSARAEVRGEEVDLLLGARPMRTLGLRPTTTIRSRFPIYIDIWREFFGLVGFPMDDVIAVALALDETLCGLSEPLHVDVELGGELTRGQTIAFEGNQIFLREFDHPPRTRICRTIDGKRFMNLFKQTMRGA